MTSVTASVLRLPKPVVCGVCHVCPAGASGFVIEPKVAEEFRLPAFGDLSIAGIAGKVCVVCVGVLCMCVHVHGGVCLPLRVLASTYVHTLIGSVSCACVLYCRATLPFKH